MKSYMTSDGAKKPPKKAKLVQENCRQAAHQLEVPVRDALLLINDNYSQPKDVISLTAFLVENSHHNHQDPRENLLRSRLQARRSLFIGISIIMNHYKSSNILVDVPP